MGAMLVTVVVSASTATIVSAASTAVYAIISALSLLLLSRQIRDARRFGAAPALYALLKEMEQHMVAVRAMGGEPDDDAAARETIVRCLEFFERIEHLRNVGVLPVGVLRQAFGPVLNAHLSDPRFHRVMEQDRDQHEEVLRLGRALSRK